MPVKSFERVVVGFGSLASALGEGAIALIFGSTA